jgi:hypothetical protein
LIMVFLKLMNSKAPPRPLGVKVNHSLHNHPCSQSDVRGVDEK